MYGKSFNIPYIYHNCKKFCTGFYYNLILPIIAIFLFIKYIILIFGSLNLQICKIFISLYTFWLIVVDYSILLNKYPCVTH